LATVDDIMSRVLASHRWMGDSLEKWLHDKADPPLRGAQRAPGERARLRPELLGCIRVDDGVKEKLDELSGRRWAAAHSLATRPRRGWSRPPPVVPLPGFA